MGTPRPPRGAGTRGQPLGEGRSRWGLLTCANVFCFFTCSGSGNKSRDQGTVWGLKSELLSALSCSLCLLLWALLESSPVGSGRTAGAAAPQPEPPAQSFVLELFPESAQTGSSAEGEMPLWQDRAVGESVAGVGTPAIKCRADPRMPVAELMARRALGFPPRGCGCWSGVVLPSSAPREGTGQPLWLPPKGALAGGVPEQSPLG